MIWMAVEADEYELPIVVADSSVELAKKLGVSATSIRVRACKRQSGVKAGVRIYRIDVLEEEDLKEGEDNE